MTEPGTTAQVRVGFKLDVPHCDDCFAVKDGDGERTFISHDGVEWRRKKNGHRGGSTMWHRFACNDPKCSAVMLVRWDAVARFVNGVKEAPK